MGSCYSNIGKRLRPSHTHCDRSVHAACWLRATPSVHAVTPSTLTETPSVHIATQPRCDSRVCPSVHARSCGNRGDSPTVSYVKLGARWGVGLFTALYSVPRCQAPRASPCRRSARGATFTVKPGGGPTPPLARATVSSTYMRYHMLHLVYRTPPNSVDTEYDVRSTYSYIGTARGASVPYVLQACSVQERGTILGFTRVI